jgi:flagellar biosynthesis chaperone FliJ
MTAQQSNLSGPVQLIGSIIEQIQRLERLEDAETECTKVKAEHDKWTKKLAMLKQEFAEAKRLYDQYLATCQLKANDYDVAERRLKALNTEIDQKSRQLIEIKAELDKLRAKFFSGG